jgi:hypothetical protein
MIRSLSNAMRIWHWTSPRTPVASATSTLQSRHFPFLNCGIRTAAITAHTDRFPYAARFDGAECLEGPDGVRESLKKFTRHRSMVGNFPVSRPWSSKTTSLMRTVLRKRLSPTHRAEVSAEIEILPVDTFPQRQKITSCPNADSVRPPTTAPLSVAPRPRSRLKLPVRRSDPMRSTEYVWLQSNGWARIYPSPWVRWPPRGHFFGSSLSPGGKTTIFEPRSRPTLCRRRIS